MAEIVDDKIKVNTILNKVAGKYYIKVSSESRGWEAIRAGWNDIIDDIDDEDSKIQDVILEGGRYPVYKKKGVWVEQKNRMMLTNESINYFLAIYAEQSVGERAKSGSPDLVTQSNPTYLLDTMLTDLLLMLHDKSYIFSMSASNKILRCILYSVFSAGSDDERYAISIRVQPKKLPELEDINVPLLVKDVVNQNSGLNLISGFAGNGKTWTMSAIVNYLNNNLKTSKVITTIEEPIEFLYKNINAHIIQREVLKNTPSFKDASSDALRQGQDIVVFGELREKEEMYNALMLAESGKQVFATIHSNSVADTLDRFVSEFDTSKQQNIRERLLENLTMILHQELIRYNREQYPVVDLVMIKNDSEREDFKKKAQSRVKLMSAVNEGSATWIMNAKDSYTELVKRGVIKDNVNARSAFRAN